jgi:hypothetical protein
MNLHVLESIENIHLYFFVFLKALINWNLLRKKELIKLFIVSQSIQIISYWKNTGGV